MLTADLLERIRIRSADPMRRTDSLLPLLGRTMAGGAVEIELWRLDDLGPAAADQLESAPLPIVASAATIAAAEERLGFELPEDLRQLYREVADGGFGPGDGIAPLLVVTERYLEYRADPPSEAGYRWPQHLVPFNLSAPGADCIDVESGAILYWNEEALADIATEREWRDSFVTRSPDLAGWLEEWLARPSAYEQQAPLPDAQLPEMDEAARATVRESLQQAIEYWKAHTPEERAEFGMPAEGWENYLMQQMGVDQDDP